MTSRIYRLCMLLLLAACTFAVSAHAELVAIPEPQSPVVDLSNVLTAQQKSQLERKLDSFESEYGSQILILIVPTTQPEDISQYSMRAVEKWGIGRDKQDDGVLITLVTEEKKSRIEVGYGLEGVLNDATANRIRVEVMRPHIRSGDIYGGLDAGTTQIISLIKGEALPAPKADTQANIAEMLPMLFFGALICGLILRSIFGTFIGSAVNGSLVGTVVWILGLAIGGAMMLGFIAFILTMILGSRGFNQYGGYPSGGNSGWGGGSSGGWSGGGGDFGGGGASGDW